MLYLPAALALLGIVAPVRAKQARLGPSADDVLWILERGKGGSGAEDAWVMRHSALRFLWRLTPSRARGVYKHSYRYEMSYGHR
jgi:hypothetical protein